MATCYQRRGRPSRFAFACPPWMFAIGSPDPNAKTTDRVFVRCCSDTSLGLSDRQADQHCKRPLACRNSITATIRAWRQASQSQERGLDEVQTEFLCLAEGSGSPSGAPV